MQTFYIQEFDQDNAYHHITGWVQALNAHYAFADAESQGFHPTGVYTRQEIEEGDDEDLQEQLKSYDINHS